MCRKYSTLIGNRNWITQNGINVSKDMNETMEEHEVKGQTAVLVAIDGKLIYALRIPYESCSQLV